MPDTRHQPTGSESSHRNPGPQEERSLSATDTALDHLLDQIGLSSHFEGDAVLEGDDVLIRSPHRLVEAVGTAQLLLGCTAAAIWQERAGETNDVVVDSIDALHSLHASHFVWQEGAYLEVGAEYVPVNGFFPTKDGRQVLLCAGPPYMKLLNGYLDFFGCANNRKAIAAATVQFTAPELEDALAGMGLPGCRAFDRLEWLVHPQGQLLAAAPVIEIEKMADGDPVPFSSGADYPRKSWTSPTCWRGHGAPSAWPSSEPTCFTSAARCTPTPWPSTSESIWANTAVTSTSPRRSSSGKCTIWLSMLTSALPVSAPPSISASV